MADAVEKAFLAHVDQVEAALCDPGALHSAGCWPHAMTVARSSRDARLAALELDTAPVEAFAARLTAAEVQLHGGVTLRDNWRAKGARTLLGASSQAAVAMPCFVQRCHTSVTPAGRYFHLIISCQQLLRERFVLLPCEVALLPAGSMDVGGLLSAEAFAACLEGVSVDAFRSVEDHEALLRRLCAAVAVFAERTTPHDGALRQMLLRNMAALHDAAGAGLCGGGKRAAAALSDALAAPASQAWRIAAGSAPDAVRSRLLLLLGVPQKQSALLPFDLTVSDALGTQLAAASAAGHGDDPQTPSIVDVAWWDVVRIGHLIRAARAAASFAALLHTVQQGAAAAVEARHESPLQLGLWRYSRPQVCMLTRCWRCLMTEWQSIAFGVKAVASAAPTPSCSCRSVSLPGLHAKRRSPLQARARRAASHPVIDSLPSLFAALSAVEDAVLQVAQQPEQVSDKKAESSSCSRQLNYQQRAGHTICAPDEHRCTASPLAWSSPRRWRSSTRSGVPCGTSSMAASAHTAPWQRRVSTSSCWCSRGSGCGGRWLQ